MDRLSTLSLVLITAVTVVSSTRCYQCRNVQLRRGNDRIFDKKFNSLKDNGWINTCSDESFVIIPQVDCAKRVYITTEMCYPNKTKRSCTVKVVERFPILPPFLKENDPFFQEKFDKIRVMKYQKCKSDLCNGEYRNQHMVGLKCYHQCGSIQLYGLTDQELKEYHLPVIPCDDTTYNYCGDDMECGYIKGSAVYTDRKLKRNITVVGWFADCFYRDSDSIEHVLDTVKIMMAEHPSLQISPADLTKCNTELCNRYMETNVTSPLHL